MVLATASANCNLLLSPVLSAPEALINMGRVCQLIALLAVASLATAAAEGDDVQQKALDYLAEHRREFTQELLHFVSIPSVSASPRLADEVVRAAGWLKRRLEKAGLEVSCVPVKGEPGPETWAPTLSDQSCTDDSSPFLAERASAGYPRASPCCVC